jgi:hypothetical protein
MSQDAAAAGGGPRFTIGAVLSAGFSVTFRNLLRFLVIELAVAIPLIAVAAIGGVLVSASATIGLGGGGNLVNMEAQGWIGMIYAGVIFFLFLLGYLLAQAAMTCGALQTLRGEPAGIGACLAQALRMAPQILGAGLLFFIALFAIMGGAGFLLFLQFDATPGIGVSLESSLAFVIVVMVVALIAILVLVVLWWVFIPAIVMERAGPIACFGRSRALTKGHRWGVLAIVVLIAVANGVVSAIADQIRGGGLPLVGDILDLVSIAFFTMVTAALAAVGYYYLRGEKEGVAIDDVVKVFD